MSMTMLDSPQVIRSVFDEATQSLKVLGVGGILVPETYDEIDLTYVAAGNGVGEIQTVTYKLSGSTVATLTLTYNASNKLTTVVKS